MVDAPSPEPSAPSVSRRRVTHRLLFLVVAIGWIVVDQASKAWAVARLPDGEIDIVGSLRFNLAYNSGASFSLGGGQGRWIAVVAVVIVVVLVWQGLQATSRLTALALAMIVGGALGNVIDRAFRDGRGGFLGGAVVDFVDVQWWPIFNVADVGVVVGAVLLVVASLLPVPDDSDGEA
ncbi:MAG TPA: signal peptidase II [Acidimicrobiales bacterium]